MTDSNPDIMLASIVCIAKNNAIGKDNGMIWHIPADLKHFKRTTMGKPILMGRKSYESLGKPLPGRPNIVISRSFATMPNDNPSPIYQDMEAASKASADGINEGPHLYASIEDGIKAMKKMAVEMEVDEVFITGGGQIYKETLPYTDRLYVTILDREYDGDVFFPQIQWNDWSIAAEEKHPSDEKNDRPSFTVFRLERR